MMIHLIINSIF